MNQEEKYQQERLKSLEHQVNLGIKVIGYLYLSNAGSIIALIGYMSEKKSALPCCWKVAVLLFLLGLICAIGAGACAYFYQAKITQSVNDRIARVEHVKHPSERLFYGSIGCAVFSAVCFMFGALIILLSF